MREKTLLLEFYLLILCKYISCPPENVSPLFGSIIKKKNRDFSNKLYPSIKQGAISKCRRNIQSLDDSLRAFPDHEIVRWKFESVKKEEVIHKLPKLENYIAVQHLTR